jgi:hypothetical protein
MRNRIPPNSDHLNLHRPAVYAEGLILTVCELGHLIFWWLAADGLYYQERYHVSTSKRVGFTFSQEPIEN